MAGRDAPLLPAALAALPLALGCVTARTYRVPMTAAELSAHREPDALVAYLTQPDASPSVCDPRSSGPRFSALGADARTALMQAFRAGRIPPPIWRGCASAVLRGADAATSSAFAGEVLAAALATIHERDLESDGGEQARLEVLQQVYAERPSAVAPRSSRADEIAAALHADLASGRLGPTGRRHAADLITLLDLESGRGQAGALDGGALDALAAAGDERTLRWAAVRAPDGGIREEARRRIIALHVRASPFPEVKADPAAVEEALRRDGRNEVAPDRLAGASAWIDPSLGAARTVVVEQHVPDHWARLLAFSAEHPVPSVLPQLPTRGSLHVAVEGLSTPITVCAPADELDPTPCLAPRDVAVETDLAALDADGLLRFVDAVSDAGAVDLAVHGARLFVPFAIAGRRVAALDWPLRFLRPDDLVLAGSDPGSRGPDLDLRVDAREPARLVYSVAVGARRLQAVVERADASSFRVVTRGANGAPGASGTPGSDGSSGVDGTSATCPSSPGSSGSRGGDGSPGGSGGAGGPGGDGGTIRVSVAAPEGVRDGLLAVLRGTIRSEGGPGGRGGSGGAGGSGGRGGRGGFGATCTDPEGHVTTLASGWDGGSGSDGARGADGPDGAPGRPGNVTFVVEP